MITVSIIIPTKNRAMQLRDLLLSIEKNTTVGSKVEVIIIDNGSNDETKEVSLSFSDRIKNLRYHYDAEPGLLTGRHAGAELSTGEVLCFLDDDVQLNSSYIETLVAVFTSDSSLHLATGPCLPKYEVEPPAWLNFFWQKRTEGSYCPWLSLLDFGNEIKTIHPNYIWGLNFCIRKETLKKLGGFHPDCLPAHLQKYQGDGETGLTLKAAEQELKASYFPKLALSHNVPNERLTLDYFKKRAYYQGICESFTQLRSANFNTEVQELTYKKTLRDRLHPYYRWIKILLPNKEQNKPQVVKNMLKTLESFENEGYNFHQNQFHNDKIVREWVLKENYWNYKLPSND